MSLLRSFCRLPCVRRAGKRRCEGGSSGPSLSPPAARFSSITSAWLLSLLDSFHHPQEVHFSRRFAGKTARVWEPPRRGSPRFFPPVWGFFFLWAPAGRTAPVGQPRRAWMSRRSDTRRWSCCCFASPCGYRNTIQPEQTPSFTSVRFKPERKRAERRPEIDYCGMLCCSAATLSIWGLWWGGVGNLTV